MGQMAARQLAILRILSGGKVVTMRELAEKTESCRRTILRDVLDLSIDYPIQTIFGRDGGVRLERTAVVGNQVLTKDEINCIIESIQCIDENHPCKQSILEKLVGCVPK